VEVTTRAAAAVYRRSRKDVYAIYSELMPCLFCHLFLRGRELPDAREILYRVDVVCLFFLF